MFELSATPTTNAVIKVIGVGGGGGNAVEHMITENIAGVDFICANTDIQALKRSSSKIVLQLGEELTKGLGAGADPEIGRLAAEENRDRIRSILADTDMIFITAGMGGGTGTGAAPIFAEIAKELNILTVAVVTKPFSFEGKKRLTIADEGIKNLTKSVDSLIIVPNNKLLPVLGKQTSLLNAFREVNNVLLGAVQGIAELITKPGLINVDFADVRTVMSETGMAMMGTAEAVGENRAREAAEAAISSPLLEDIDLNNASGVLVNITAGSNMTIGEFEEIGEVIKSFTSENATVVIGTVINPDMSDNLRVTIVVTGLGRQPTTASSGNENLVPNRQKYSDPLKMESHIDFHKLDKPSIMRGPTTANMMREEVAMPHAGSANASAAATNAGSAGNHPAPSAIGNAGNQSTQSKQKPAELSFELLDVPAFLRKKEK